MRSILDTDVVISDRPADDESAISVVTLAELHHGVLQARDHERAQRLERLVNVTRAFDALPVDEAVGAAYGRVASAVRATGRKVSNRNFDLLIAATALTHDARLLTNNLDDYRGLEGLVEVVSPA